MFHYSWTCVVHRSHRFPILMLSLLYGSAAFGGAGASANQPVIPEPADYRLHDYRAPVPDTLAGAQVVAADGVRTLRDQADAILVDVLPAPRKPAGLKSGDLWLPPPHRNIPGSIWLADVGYGVLSDDLDLYFRTNLERATAGDKTRKLVIYCRDNCWMSWNAAKRAISYGYSSVYWFPEGTEGWFARGFSMGESTPVPQNALGTAD